MTDVISCGQDLENTRFQGLKFQGFQRYFGTRTDCRMILLAYAAEFAGTSLLGRGWMNIGRLSKTQDNPADGANMWRINPAWGRTIFRTHDQKTFLHVSHSRLIS